MRKEYKSQQPYRPDHDYKTGAHAADKHIRDLTKQGTHPGQAQHLGGMASYKQYLEELNDGEAYKVRKEIKHVLDYLFYYHQADHDIFYFLAKEIHARAEKMASEIKDPQEKEHAQYFVDAAKEYMHKLKEESDRHRSMGHHGGQSPYVHDPKGKMITPREMEDYDRNPDQLNLRMEGAYNARRGVGRPSGEMEYNEMMRRGGQGGGTRSEMEREEMRRRTTGPSMNIYPYENQPMMPTIVPYNEYQRRGGTRSEMEYNEMRRGGQGGQGGSQNYMYPPQWFDSYDAYQRQGGTRSESDYNEMRRGGQGGNRSEMEYRPQDERRGPRNEMEREEAARRGGQGGQGGSRSEMETNRQNPQGANQPGTVNL